MTQVPIASHRAQALPGAPPDGLWAREARETAGIFVETEHPTSFLPFSPNLLPLLRLDCCNQGQSQRGQQPYLGHAGLPSHDWEVGPGVFLRLLCQAPPSRGGGHLAQPPLSLAPDTGAWLCDLFCSGPRCFYPTKGYMIPPLPPPRLVLGSTESDEEMGWEEEAEGSPEVMG